MPRRTILRTYINRELSWLEFNNRVLDQARDGRLPLLERVKFLGITASNLDEFFMVRVGGLQMLAAQGITRRDPSGLAPAEQLDAISRRTHAMVSDQYSCHAEIERGLARAGIRRRLMRDLNERQQRYADQLFEREVAPILTPLAAPGSADLPLLANRTLHLAVRLSPDQRQSDRPRFAVVPLGRSVSRLLSLPADDGYECLCVEDLVYHFSDRLFLGQTVIECVPFRITRNADMSVREDMAGDLLAQMEAVLEARKRSDCVRLEILAGASSAVLTFLQKALRLPKQAVYPIDGPLDLGAFTSLANLSGFGKLRTDPWPPQPSPGLSSSAKMFDVIAAAPVLLYHPFESFEPVIRLLEQAADDPDVVAIKQILYRTSRTSPIVKALLRAAAKGKYVTVLVELKARFDEERNIEWAQELEDAGVQVVYGVKGLKTHAKALMVIRREPAGLRRYLHFGTGNYNEMTAQLYCDASYLTADEDLAADATAFFHAITGYSQPQKFRRLDMAPISLRERILTLIQGEIDRKREDQQAFIRVKVNSLADPEIISRLYVASKVGVKIDLNVRGICCLRPGVPGLSENITVTSIVDRFLEHARILHFHNGGKDLLYISTADWMPRNLDKRVELLVPVLDAPGRRRLVQIMDHCLADSAQAWRLGPEDRYERIAVEKRRRPARSQEILYDEACRAIRLHRQTRRVTLEVHRPARARK